MYADPVSKACKIYLQMDEAGDIIIVLNDHVTTWFNNHEKTTNGKLEDHNGTIFLWDWVCGRWKITVGFFMVCGRWKITVGFLWDSGNNILI